MTLQPCFKCAAVSRALVQDVRKAERAHARGASVDKHMASIERHKRWLAECEANGHSGMQEGRDATRARHAAARGGAA